MDSFLSLLQFADGLFPAGAYAHSFGLEYFVQCGEVSSAAGVEDFLRTYLEGSVAPTDAVAAMCAWRAAKLEDLATCLTLDETLDAMKTASELRDASRQMGRQMLRVANHLPCNLPSNEFLTEFSQAVGKNITPGHHSVVFGMIGGLMEWPAQEMVSAYLYSTSAALVGAALRLMPLGQLAGQHILWNVQPLIAKLAQESQSKLVSDTWSFAPALEIGSTRHALLDARLFRS